MTLGPPTPFPGSTPPLPAHGASSSARWRTGGRAIGAQIDRFVIEAELGRGGMGVVYQAQDVESGRRVALKLVLEAGLGTDRLTRFRREGEITASLNHVGIVRVYGGGEVNGRPWLAYELVEGCRPLDAVLPELELPARVALVRDAARALGFAHARGVVHRDVKPENLLVDSAGRLRVADFGLALASDVERLTRTGALVGTPHYMAPEQLRGSSSGEAPAASCDVWALGVVLYQALTGQLPFEGASLIELMGQIASGQTPPPRRLEPGVPPALEAVCLKALAPAPAERYPDAGALADDLDRALAGEAVSARAPGGGGLRRAAWVAVPSGAAALLLLVASTYQPTTPHLPDESPAETAQATATGPSDEPPAKLESEPTEPTEPAEDAGSEAAPPKPRDPAALLRGVADFFEAQGDAIKPGAVDVNVGDNLYDLGRYAEAAEMFLRAANKGHVRAMRLYARLLLAGHDGVTRDELEARRWLTTAAIEGDEDAMMRLGDLWLEPTQFEPDEMEAFRWYYRAAEAGEVRGMERVAQMLTEGVGTEKNPAAAKEWLQKARAAHQAKRKRERREEREER